MSGNHRANRLRSGRLTTLLTAVVIASIVAGCSLLEPSPAGSPGPDQSAAASPSAAGGTTPSTQPTVAPASPARWTNCGTKFQCADPPRAA